MTKSLSPTALKVQELLRQLGCRSQVIELPDSTRTAADAARANGCEIGQIAKSLVFVTRDSCRPVLVITSGANRVNEKLIGELLGEPIQKADADFVRQATGYAVGGIPPVGHRQEILTFIDRDLLQYGEIWAAAGTPNSQFRVAPQELVEISGGRVVSVTN